MQEEIFRVRNADVKLFNQLVLEKVNFQIYRGEIVGVHGTMDLGKTTLVKMISGEIEADSGYVYYKGRLVSENGGIAQWHPNTVVINQTLELVESMSVWENVLLSQPKIAGVAVNPKTTARVIGAMLQSYGIDVAPQMVVAQIGQEKKLLLKILCARMRKAEVIILDDIPFSYTAQQYQHLREMLNMIRMEGITTVITSCQTKPLTLLSDRVLLLHKKHIVAELPAADVQGIERLIARWFSKMEHEGNAQSVQDKVAVSFVDFPQSGGPLVSFDVRAGQIVSVRDSTRILIGELRKALTGSAKTCGRVCRDGKPIRPMEGRMVQDGLVYIDCGLAELITEDLSPIENICIGDYRRFSTGGIVKKRVTRFVGEQFRRWYGNSQAVEKPNCMDLSNADKTALVLFRLKLMKPKVLIMDEGISSMDRSAMDLFEQTLKELAQEGTAICLWNTSVEALPDIADYNILI